MNQAAAQLPENLHHLQIEEKDIYLLGTAHISQQSVQDVQVAAQQVHPDTICVELCSSRYNTIINPEAWKKMNIFKVIKEKKALFLLVQLILSAFYRRIGEKIGVKPGADMLEGINQAKQLNAQLILADRDVNITLRRVWGYLSLWHKLKMFFQLLFSLFASENVDRDLIEELKQKDQLEVVMDTLAQSFPEVKNRLIDERDIYLAQKIRQAPGSKILAIAGMGHVKGILEHIQTDNDLTPLLQTPPKSIIPKIIKWLIPLAIVTLIVVGFFRAETENPLDSIYIWILANGVFSALGVSLALAHPLTIFSAFVAAPLTSLNPTIAAGWVSGLVQAWVKKPTVADLENIPLALSSIKQFWSNPVCRILLVVILANIGSTLGTILAGSWIATLVL